MSIFDIKMGKRARGERKELVNEGEGKLSTGERKTLMSEGVRLVKGRTEAKELSGVATGTSPSF